MDFNFITNIEICQMYKSQAPLNLIYYSHIPTIIIALIFGFFVFFKKRDLASKILLAISVTFSLWLTLDLLIWEYGYNSIITMLSWAILVVPNILFFIFSLYFVYVFIDKKDISFKIKVILLILLLPIVLILPTKLNVSGFDGMICEAIENNYFVNYYIILEIVISLWIILFSFIKYKKTKDEFRKQILLLAVGISIFLISYFAFQYTAYKLENFKIEQYGLFGITVFIGFLSYLIVKYKAFDIKLLGAQALVIAQFIIIASQFAFIENPTNRILTAITLIITTVMGYALINSVRNEVKRKEELQNMSDELASANDKLRKLDNAKSEFISIASHQLRTPLTAVKGYISLLLEGSYGKVEKKQQDVMNKVYISNERLIHLVEDLLNVSRIESGRMEFNFAKTKMENLCQEIIDTFVIRAKDSKLYLNYEKPKESLPELMIDASKVREVISNIVDNALKYTPKGGVILKLESIKKQAEGKDFVRIIVSDTGIGIPQSELPYLFSKFSRGKDIKRLSVSGTGLGLYVGKSLVEANGGTIWAESDGEGKGSRFIIELPVEQSKEILEKYGN